MTSPLPTNATAPRAPALGGPANAIPSRQNEPAQIKLLMARRQTYKDAERLQRLQVAVAVLLPLAGAVAALIWPGARPFVALAALAILLVDAVFLDRPLKALLTKAARIAEEFDCQVLQIPWNGFAVGARPKPEEVQEATRRFTDGGGTDAELLDWYPPVVGRAPLGAARIVCQRTNIWYDQSLRRRASFVLLAAALLLVILLTAVGIAVGLSLPDFMLTVAAPATPILGWALREQLRQADTAKALDAMRVPIDQLFERLRTRQCDDAECLSGSQDFQAAVYAHRARSPLPPPWIYARMRPGMEVNMNANAEELLARLGITAGDGEEAKT